MANPYSTPASNIEKGLASKSTLRAFSQRSTLFVVLVSIVTLGIYSIVWAVSRTKMLNTESTSNPLPISQLILGWVLIIASNVPVALAGDQPNLLLGLLAMGLSIGGMVFMLMWVFGFRKRLHTLVGISHGDPRWANGFLLFLLNVYYLNYKINQIKEIS